MNEGKIIQWLVNLGIDTNTQNRIDFLDKVFKNLKRYCKQGRR